MLKLVSHSPRLSARLDKAKPILKERGLDAFIIFKPENLRYLTGFRGTTGALIILPDKAILVVDPRYGEEAEREASNVDVLVGRTIKAQIVGFSGDARLDKIGLESSGLTYGDYEDLVKELSKRKKRPEIFPVRDVVEKLRAVKDGGEIDDLKKAAALADRCVDYLAGELKTGLSERDASAMAFSFLRKEGSEGESFETIVASGENSSMPHASTTDRVIESGDLVIIDLGAVVNGYHSDITRTFVAGKPSYKQREMHRAVILAQDKIMNALKPGLSAGEADEICRSLLDKEENGKFLHSLGHGVGLEIHERPQLGAGSAEELIKGMVFTIEPGLYTRGIGGVRIEDMILLQDAPVVLTAFPRDLTEI